MVCAALTIASLGIGALALLLANAYKSGLFSRLGISEVTFGPYLLLYVNAQAPYSTAPKVCKELRRLVVEEARMDSPPLYEAHTRVGFYFDDPKATPAAKCRFSFGYQVDTYGSTDLDGYAQSLEAQLSVCKNGELKVGKFPESRCLAVKLPFYGTLSIMNAVFRGYPFLIQQAISILGKQQADATMALGLLEVYHPKEHTMYVVLPITPRTTMLPF